MTDLIIPASYMTKRSFKDGTVEVKVLVEPRYERTLLDICSQPGAPLAIARLAADPERAMAEFIQETEGKRPYGQQARNLRLSAFFRTPEVWHAIGRDEELQAWVRARTCLACGASPPGVAAHVRSVADGAGTGVKPPFSVIPLCHDCHEASHQQGIVRLTGADSVHTAREQLQKWRIDTVMAWAWETLREFLGYGSWSEVPPGTLRGWADAHSLEYLLPEDYR